MQSWSREQVYGSDYTHRPLDEFLADAQPVQWLNTNPYKDKTEADVFELMLREVKWRHHHGFEELRRTAAFYRSYADRVDALLAAVDTAVSLLDLDLAEASCLDIAAAEGYVANHLFELGAREVDCLELNLTNIERMWMVRAARGIDPGRIARLDLERLAWSNSIERSYTLTLALGILYHMENPMLFLRNLFEVTEFATIIESDTPHFPDNQRFRGRGIVYLHRDQVTLSSGNVRHFTEMRPDRQALVEMVLAAGFQSVVEIPPATRSPYGMYDTGEKTVVVATVEPIG